MSQYFPDVAWRTVVRNVTVEALHSYNVTVAPINPNEPGAVPMQLEPGYWLIDNGGYTFEITAVNGNVITVYDVNERTWGSSTIGPRNNLEGYIYEAKNGAFMLTQAQLRFLDRSAADVINPVEKGIVWAHRGMEIDGDYDGTPQSVLNITKLALSSEFVIKTEAAGWQGGKGYTLTLDGLLHNRLPDIQGTGLDDDYIHLDQDQVDALWTKDGANITRDSNASLTGIVYVNEIKSYTDELPLIKKDGSNVRVSTCILSDCVNDRIGLFTETPLDHLHLTGYARISTLAEASNSSIVTANEHGRLIKLPYDNNNSKYLRSDGTWGVVLTQSGDFLDSVIAMQVGNTLDPSTATGARYILLDTSDIHTNFKGSYADIATWLSTEGIADNDIVVYNGTNFELAFDSSAAMQPATVTVGTDKNGNTNHQWTYNVTDDIWVDRGAAVTHNSLDGLNDGDYKHLTATEYGYFGDLTDGSDISNILHNHNTQYAIKQSSVTDTTSGRGLIVGAFGLGRGSIILTSSEWDVTSMPNQFVRATNSSDSIFNRAGVGIHLRYSTSYAAQLFMAVTGTLSIKARATSTSGVWGAAQELYHTGNLVNPVTGTGTAGQIAIFNGDGSITSVGGLVYSTSSKILYNYGRMVNDGEYIMTIAPIESFWGFVSRNSDGAADSGIYFNAKNATLRLRDTGNTNRIILNSNTDSYLTYGLSIGKTSVTSGYMLDVNGAIMANGNIRGESYLVGTNTVIDTNRNAAFFNLVATGKTTLSTSLSGLLKATSGVVSIASPNNDYLTPEGIAGSDPLYYDAQGRTMFHSNTASVRHVTDTEKAAWNGKENALTKGTLSGDAIISVTANRMVIGGSATIAHSTAAGNKHIPTGGASGQVLKYSASGTAVWGDETDTITTINGKTGAIAKADITALGIPAQDTTYGDATTSASGLMSSDDKTKLNGIATNANNYVHPAKTWVDKTALANAVVVSNITVDALGHPTGWTTRTLTLANLGYTGATNANYYTHPDHIGDVTSAGDGTTTIAAKAVTYAKFQDVTASRMLGRVTTTTGSTEELTAAQVRSFINVADGANNYSLPLSSSTTRGGVKIGYTDTGASIALKLSSEKGYVTLTNAAVVGGLGYTPYNASNPSGYINGITSGMVTAALGYTPYNATNPSGYISSITKAMVEGVLTGVVSSHTHSYLPLSGGTLTGKLVLSSTFPSDQGVLNIPNIGTSDPSSTVAGDIWHRSNVFRYKDGAGVVRQLAHTGSWGAMSVAEGQAATVTSSRFVRSDYLKQIIEYHGDNKYSLASHTHTFASLTSKPTTLSGYGITDGVTGTGTAGYIPKFTGTSSLGNSVIYETSGAVAINKTSVTSGYMLDVNGAIISSGNIRGASYNVGTTPVIDASRNASFANLTATGTTTLGTLNGILKATSGVVSEAVAEIDYLTPGGIDAYTPLYYDEQSRTVFHTDNASIRHVTDTQIGTWNSKQDALVSGTNIKTINSTSILGSGNISITSGATSFLGLSDTPANYTNAAYKRIRVNSSANALEYEPTQTPQTLTVSSNTLTWNVANGYNAIVTLNANVTSFNFSGAIAGDSGVLTVIQDATGSRTMVIPAGHRIERGELNLSVEGGSVDVLGWYFDGVRYLWNYGNWFKTLSE